MTASPPPEPLASPVSKDRFREVFREWPAGVALVAVRDGGRVYATTLTSLVPVSADPPTLLFSLGPTAQVLPFLEARTRFAVSLLARDQAPLAHIHADAFPVGPSPFPLEGDPLVAGSLARLVCEVSALVDTGAASRLVLARILEGSVEPDRPPLLYRRRRYAGIDEEG
jgi:flavin reductase (DIM6/NTAB) family NADH-FMN oxidoreductase RutF